MNKLDKQYQDLLQTILDYGVEKKDRTGTGTKSIFGYTIRHNMQDGFPVLTTKKMAWKTMVTELLWFLRGDTNIKFLVDNGCHIWDGDAYKNWVFKNSEPDQYWLSQEEFINKIKTDDEFAKKWGELGPIYGKQWRKWGSNIIDELGSVYTNEVDYDIQNGKLPYGSSNRKFVIDEIKKLNPSIDQIQNLINDLKTKSKDPLSRSSDYFHKHMDSLRVPKRAISLMWNQRSVDTFLGLPFNIASYGLLLTILAKEVNMVPDQLIGNLGDTHLYLNHIEQAKEQIGREPFELPTLNQFPTYEGSRPSIESYVVGDFTLKDYQSHPSIKAPLSN